MAEHSVPRVGPAQANGPGPSDGTGQTLSRYDEYASRIDATSPSYAAWARAVDQALAKALEAVPPTKRQPELAFAVARRLGADPSDPLAFRRLLLDLEAGPAFFATLASATTQTNDPRRLAPLVPVIGAVAAGQPIALLEIGVSAGLTAVPDFATVDYLVAGVRRRIATGRSPAFGITAEAAGAIPDPVAAFDVVTRVGLDPAPIDLAVPEEFDRLVESVPPEATDRIALMRVAARATRAAPPDLIAGTVEQDLGRALDHLLSRMPAAATPIVLTVGTLVYVPGIERQRFVDTVLSRGVRWIAMERTGTLADVSARMPDAQVLASLGTPLGSDDAFATISLDGRPVAVSDPFGTRIRWFDQL